MRARNIKPGFYKNADLLECSRDARLLAPGLWMMADREGRLEDRPKQIKIEIFPCDDVDINRLLDELASHNHITRYDHGGKPFIQICKFSDHQRPHSNEIKSTIPEYKQQHKKELSSKVESASNLGAKHFALNDDTLTTDSHLLNAECVVAREENPFTKIYDAGSAVFPVLATANTSSIHQWISAGCKAELDVIPEIQRHAKAGKAVKAWSYFTGGIMDAYATRTTAPSAGSVRQREESMDERIARLSKEMENESIQH